MRLGVVFFALAAAAIVAAWGWLGAAVEMPASPLGPGEKIPCVSYAPFRGDQDPFGPDVPIDPRQIEEDLVRLKPLTDCIRTYSVDHGLDQIPESLFPLLACRGALSLSVLDITIGVAVFFAGEVVISLLLYKVHIRDRPY